MARDWLLMMNVWVKAKKRLIRRGKEYVRRNESL